MLVIVSLVIAVQTRQAYKIRVNYTEIGSAAYPAGHSTAYCSYKSVYCQEFVKKAVVTIKTKKNKKTIKHDASRHIRECALGTGDSPGDNAALPEIFVDWPSKHTIS